MAKRSQITCSILVFLLPCFVCGCSGRGSDIQTAEDSINARDLERHVLALASDEFQGRKPFTEGETKTVAYLAAEFEKMGFEGAIDGSFYQQVPLVEIDARPSAEMEVAARGGTVRLRYPTDFIASTRRIVPDVELDASPLVFAGYGIVAPEYGWDDYNGADVTGKTVVVLVNDPGFATEDEALFKGTAMTYYGRWTYKYEEAARQGAAGVLVVHETVAAGYPWTVLENGAAGSDLVLQSADDGTPYCAVEGWVTSGAAQELFRAAGMKFDELSRRASHPGFRAVPLGANASVSIQVASRFDNSRNVVAILRGRDRADECIVYTSHWDHLGIGPAVDGDSIYNGAADNALPLSCMLETAKAFSNLRERLSRSVLFVAVTAEETGLLGSEYYAEHPVIPLEKTAANLNYELFLPMGRMKDVTIYGYGQSELDGYVAKAAGEQGRYVAPEPHPENGMYFRTDHFSFAKRGVPALFVKGWTENAAHGKEWTSERIREYWSNDYHRPTDEYDPGTADLEGIVEDAKLFFKIGVALASGSEFPRWNDASEFKKIRRESMNN